MAVLYSLYVSFLHIWAHAVHSLAALPVCVAVPAVGMQNTCTCQFSRCRFRPIQFFLSINSDLWIKTCFFLASAHCRFLGSCWCTSTSVADNYGGPGIEAVGAWPPPLVEWDKQVRQCLSAVLLAELWSWECKEKCRITNLHLKAFTSERLGL